MAYVIAFASGKGGVGKSTLAANIGYALTQAGSSAILVDADTGLRSLDLLCSSESQCAYDLIDAATKKCTLSQALISVRGSDRFSLLPASQFGRTKDLSRKQFRQVLLELREMADFVLVDCPAGLERGVRTVLTAGVDQIMIVVTPDDISIRDAEHLIQILHDKKAPRPSLLINRISAELVRRGEMLPASSVASLLDLPLTGEIPEDLCVMRSQLKHAFVLDYQCPARDAVIRIASRLRGESVPFPSIGTSRSSFWQRVIFPSMKEVTPLDSH